MIGKKINKKSVFMLLLVTTLLISINIAFSDSIEIIEEPEPVPDIPPHLLEPLEDIKEFNEESNLTKPTTLDNNESEEDNIEQIEETPEEIVEDNESETIEEEPEINIDLCLNKNCSDNDKCTSDSCKEGTCINTLIPRCSNQPSDKPEFNPENANYLLLNEFPGTSFGIETDKKEYSLDEEVLAKINAPDEADVELYFDYEGVRQYIKIPKDKGYPLDYSLPLPRKLKQGIYLIQGAIYYAGTILKTNTYFKIGEGTYSQPQIVPEPVPIKEPIVKSIEEPKEQQQTEPIISGIKVDIPVEPVYQDKQINIALEYNSNSEYDIDDNGIEDISGVIDFSIKPTIFSWQVNEENLCTQWIIKSSESVSESCYGSNKCCSFVNLAPTERSWKDPFSISYNPPKSTNKNTISARVIYVDYELSLADPHSEIVYSDFDELTATFNEIKNIIENNQIEIGKPVKWAKKVNIENYDDEDIAVEISVDIPSTAKNIIVAEKEEQKILSSSLKNSDVIIQDELDGKESKEYIVEFETAAPIKQESEPIIEENTWKKEVTISSNPEYEGEYEYKDVLSYSEIKESKEEDIRLYWLIDGEKVDVTEYELFDLKYLDENNNNLIDKITWITPHLSTQEFEIVIQLTAAESPFEEDMSIILTSPSSGEEINTNNIDFGFTLNYNSSIPNIECDISVDGTPIATNIPAITNSTETQIELEEGLHTWFVSCSGDIGQEINSIIDTFTIDTTPPTVTIHNEDPDLSLMDYFDINFTATDIIATYLTCNLTINNILNKTGIQTTSDQLKTISLVGIENGTYIYNISCSDTAGNVGNSPTQTFNVDVSDEFKITPNKNKYSLGESGVFVLSAPYASEVTLLITDSKSNTETREYTGPYPLIDNLNTFYYPGTYIIEGFLAHQGAVKTIKQHFEVSNSISVSIDIDKDTIKPEDSIKFKGSSSGGIGDLTYQWDFDDGTDYESSNPITHSFLELGHYSVTLTAEDEKGNKASAQTTIYVEDKYTIDITVSDSFSKDPLEDAKVYFNGDYKTTDSSGKTSYNMFKGEYPLFVKHSGYYANLTHHFVDKSFDITVELVKADTNESYNSSIKNNQTREETLEEPEEVITNAATSEVLTLINDAIYEIENLPASSKQVASLLGVFSTLEKAKISIERSNRDLYNLEINRKGLSDEEIQKEKERINAQIGEVKNSAIKSFEILDSEEFVKYPSSEEISDITLDFIDSKSISLNNKKTSKFIEKNKEIQSLITTTTKVNKISVEYLSGEKEEIQLVIHTIKTGNDIKDTSFIVSIPKEIAESIDDLTVLTKHDVINPDPILSFDLSANDEIVYYIKDTIELSKLKQIDTLLIYDPNKIEYTNGLPIIGFAIFSKVTNIDNPIVVIEVLAIIILLLVYLSYQFDLTDKFKKIILLRNKDLIEINDLIKDAYTCLNNNEVSNASIVYEDVMGAYKKLSKNSKSKIHIETKKLYDKILFEQLNEILNITLAHIKDNDLKQAKSKYNTIQDHYKNLPKEYKGKVKERCTLVFEKLTIAK